MRVIRITEPAARFGVLHPQEDYALCARSKPVFAVADGVTLERGADGAYPAPSSAAQAARLFCEAALRAAEERYENFAESDLLEVFRAGNEAVGAYNRAQGRTKETVDYFTHDFFAAAAAFALVKDTTLYWFSLCDARVAVFDEAGAKKLLSPEPWSAVRAEMAKLKEADPALRRRILRRTYRNSGGPAGYGVATGEREAEHYLTRGVLALAPGDFYALYTDGFEHYFELPEFVSLLQTQSGDLETRVRDFTARKAQEDPARFGEERSLIVAFPPAAARGANVPERILVHHSSGTAASPQFDLINISHRERGFQKSSLGYFVGYHYLIEKDGSVVQARQENEMGRHSKGQNFNSIGICLVGNFDEEMPAQEQINALGRLLVDIAGRHGIEESDIVPHRAHRDTHCYGLLLPDDWARDVYRAARR